MDDTATKLRRAAAERARRQQALDQADEELQAAIRAAFEQGLGGPAIAQASGLSTPRVYQIRDGRR
jgi:hypothetical protein